MISVTKTDGKYYSIKLAYFYRTMFLLLLFSVPSDTSTERPSGSTPFNIKASSPSSAYPTFPCFIPTHSTIATLHCITYP